MEEPRKLSHMNSEGLRAETEDPFILGQMDGGGGTGSARHTCPFLGGWIGPGLGELSIAWTSSPSSFPSMVGFRES